MYITSCVQSNKTKRLEKVMSLQNKHTYWDPIKNKRTNNLCTIVLNSEYWSNQKLKINIHTTYIQLVYIKLNLKLLNHQTERSEWIWFINAHCRFESICLHNVSVFCVYSISCLTWEQNQQQFGTVRVNASIHKKKKKKRKKKKKKRELLTCWVKHSLSPQAFFQKLPTGLTSHDLDLCIDATAQGWKQHVPCCFLICNTSLENMQSTSQSCYNTGPLF